MVDVKLKKKFKTVVSLQKLKTIAGLTDMVLLQKGSRLSVQPVGKKHWDMIVKLAESD